MSGSAPAASWAALVARERSGGFAHLRGTRAEIAIPIRQALVDRLVASVLAGRDATGVRIDLLEGARLGVEATHRVFGIPARARTTLDLEREVDLQRHRVVLRHDDSLLWRTIRPIVAALGLLPAGVSFGPGGVEVDLRALAVRGGWDDLLPLLGRLVIHGPADGLFAVEADLEVGEGFGPASRERDVGQGFSPASASASPSFPRVSAEQLLADLAGSRARVEVHVDEVLANDAIALARALAGEGPAPARVPWTSFVRDARVRLEAGRLVVLLDLELPDA